MLYDVETNEEEGKLFYSHETKFSVFLSQYCLLDERIYQVHSFFFPWKKSFFKNDPKKKNEKGFELTFWKEVTRTM